MTAISQTDGTWLAQQEIDAARQRLPILYIDAVPVRLGELGELEAVGLLLRVTGEGSMTRSLVSGRVLYHEQVRHALIRHIEKDLGPLALPRIPASPQPFTIAEYFPTPGVSAFHDPRQHAVSLAYIVPVEGDCAPAQDALEVKWYPPQEAASARLQAELGGGQGVLLRQAVAHLGF